MVAHSGQKIEWHESLHRTSEIQIHRCFLYGFWPETYNLQRLYHTQLLGVCISCIIFCVLCCALSNSYTAFSSPDLLSIFIISAAIVSLFALPRMIVLSTDIPSEYYLESYHAEKTSRYGPCSIWSLYFCNSKEYKVVVFVLLYFLAQLGTLHTQCPT